jgi:hypothetical protein
MDARPTTAPMTYTYRHYQKVNLCNQIVCKVLPMQAPDNGSLRSGEKIASKNTCLTDQSSSYPYAHKQPTTTGCEQRRKRCTHVSIAEAAALLVAARAMPAS